MLFLNIYAQPSTSPYPKNENRIAIRFTPTSQNPQQLNISKQDKQLLTQKVQKLMSETPQQPILVRSYASESNKTSAEQCLQALTRYILENFSENTDNNINMSSPCLLYYDLCVWNDNLPETTMQPCTHEVDKTYLKENGSDLYMTWQLTDEKLKDTRLNTTDQCVATIGKCTHFCNQLCNAISFEIATGNTVYLSQKCVLLNQPHTPEERSRFHTFHCNRIAF